MRAHTTTGTKSRKLALLAAAFTAVPILAVVGIVQAATLTSASLTVGDPRPYGGTPAGTGDAVKYDYLGSNITAATPIKCVQLKFSANPDGSGVVTGLDTTLAGVAVNSAESTLFASHTGFALDKTTNGTLKYTYATGTAPSSGSARHFVVDGIRNGTVVNDDFYLTFTTYTNTDCATGLIDSSIVGYVYTNGQQVSLTVDGSLTFSVAGVTGNGALTANGQLITNGLVTTASTIPFGTLTASTNRVAAQDLSVSTNSGQGYTVYTRYTAKPTAGTFTIDDLPTYTNATPGTFTGPGTEAFGYTTEDASLGTGTVGRFAGNKWAAFTASNAEVAYNGTATANQTTRVGFQAGIAGTTEPGAYTTTVIYTATPVY